MTGSVSVLAAGSVVTGATAAASAADVAPTDESAEMDESVTDTTLAAELPAAAAVLLPPSPPEVTAMTPHRTAATAPTMNSGRRSK